MEQQDPGIWHSPFDFGGEVKFGPGGLGGGFLGRLVQLVSAVRVRTGRSRARSPTPNGISVVSMPPSGTATVRRPGILYKPRGEASGWEIGTPRIRVG